MILFKKWDKHKIKPHVYYVNQFLCKKKWNQACKQKQSLLFNFCNTFYILTFRTQKIAWWATVLKPDFYIFSYNEQLRKVYRNFIDKRVSYLLKKQSNPPFKSYEDFVIFVHSSDLCCTQVSMQVFWYLCWHFFRIYSLRYITEPDLLPFLNASSPQK